jgi:hypothetical protein
VSVVAEYFGRRLEDRQTNVADAAPDRQEDRR